MNVGKGRVKESRTQMIYNRLNRTFVASRSTPNFSSVTSSSFKCKMIMF